MYGLFVCVTLNQVLSTPLYGHLYHYVSCHLLAVTHSLPMELSLLEL